MPDSLGLVYNQAHKEQGSYLGCQEKRLIHLLISLSLLAPTLMPSPNGTARVGEMFTISCTPSDLDVAVVWSMIVFLDGVIQLPLESGDIFEIPTNGQTLVH